MNDETRQFIKTLEGVISAQSGTIKNQSELIVTLQMQRDEAVRNLQTASEQWAVWRKQELQ